tara:strand:+ start:118 stop:603 length:486 start_codon:yes stop_codon:yes gene_type:complete
MIISCPSCNKKFEIDATLIPKNGRLLQCGSCSHKWYFKNLALEDNFSQDNFSSQDEYLFKDINLNDVEKKSVESLNKIEIPENEDINANKIDEAIDNKSSLSTSKILNYLLVIIISFIALVILLDTFKVPLRGVLPGLENVLQNLNETLKDIFLFFKDLVI